MSRYASCRINCVCHSLQLRVSDQSKQSFPKTLGESRLALTNSCEFPMSSMSVCQRPRVHSSISLEVFRIEIQVSPMSPPWRPHPSHSSKAHLMYENLCGSSGFPLPQSLWVTAIPKLRIKQRHSKSIIGPSSHCCLGRG